MIKPIVSLISLYGIENNGVRLISSVLKKHGFKVNIIFFKKWINNNIHPPTKREFNILLELLKKTNTDIVGISFSSAFFKIASTLSTQIRYVTKIPVIFGGMHAIVVPEECIKVADMVCTGEGEFTMLELVRALHEKKDIRRIKNLWIKTDNKIIKNERRELIQDLDALPYRDFEFEDKYFIEKNRLHTGDPFYKTAELRINASRGCPFRCSFCFNNVLRKIYANLGKYYRKRSVDNVIGELEYATKRLKKVRRIKFDDDIFPALSPEWIDEFCEKYKKRINIPFDIFLHPDMVDEKMLWKLKKAGLTRIQMGLQSGSEQEVERTYDRKPGNENVLKFARLNQKLKFDIVYDVILDNPLATEEDNERLFNFLMEIPRPFKLFLYSLTVFPKTTIAEKLLSRGLITEDDIEGAATKCFKQFRLSLNYPRPKKDIFLISLIVLVTKNFIPKALIWKLSKSEFLKKHPYPLKIFAEICNLIKITFIFLKMLVRRELSILKIREFGSFTRLLTQ